MTMKTLKILAAGAVIFMCLSSAPASAGVPVTCVNCSTVVQQILDSITMANELTTAINQYEQMIMQTAQQVQMVQYEIQRLKNLPENLVNKYTGKFTELASLLNQTATYRGDISALVDIYRDAYPDFNVMYGLVNGEDPNAYQREWQRRQVQFDRVARDAFGFSGSQLKRLHEDMPEMQATIQDLLSQKNETEIQQAANTMTSMMLYDLKDLKALTAQQMQFDISVSQNALKQEQLEQAQNDLFRTVTDVEYKDVRRKF
jgi:P-type conjugative transfer protein TrbJ